MTFFKHFFKHRAVQISLAALVGLSLGIGCTYWVFERLMRDGLFINAQYQLAYSVKTAQALRDSDFAKALAIQEGMVVDAVKKADIVLRLGADADQSTRLHTLQTQAKDYIAKHPATLLRNE